MGRGLSNRSIIQSTLLNITISVFILSMILIFLFGQTFWQKESIKLDYELLSIAIEAKERIVSQYIERLAEDNASSRLSENNDIQKLSGKIEPLLQEASPYSVAYYDIEADWVFSEEEKIKYTLDQILPNLSENNGTQHLRLEHLSLVSISIVQDNQLLGYVWAFADNPEFNLISFSSVNIFFVFIFALLSIIILLINKHLKNIQTQLENFSESIVHPETVPMWDVSKLPELVPVFHKIMDYTQELSSMNEELLESQQRLTQIMEGISDGLLSLDTEWRILFYNQVTKKHFNLSDKDLYMKSVFQVIPGFQNTTTHQLFASTFNQLEPRYFEADGIVVKGKYYNFSVYPFHGGITIFFRDITERRLQQQEMGRLERLNLIGQMAAGISHEIRNPLTTVKGFLQLRSSKVNDPEEKEYNELMISEIDRANTIITEFLSLAKSNIVHNTEQDINQIIYRIFPMIQADANNTGKEILLNLNPLPSLTLNENEIRQLLLNLVRNALEVTSTGGCIIIRTYEEGNHVILAVQDQGPGIPAEIQEKIGTPFFTTKESGTGLGIAISMGIAHRNNGDLGFETSSQGTTFKAKFKKLTLVTG
ncbi:signal transduction histidine kinase, nitrogen specific [Desulfitobacterium dichloroeliminans LMG P-21439]|uniref:histidine kinase n=1 Tax=Desulfitobacterium dichloroeliminans (strain LMG P-21439 / DCA1) TaxID=871963 RepID=L0F590_DESDL|nr:ATP-binding protein [Desulfitobacterium dichloroeliminans]AGA68200.1 signal transduction histidine kinase, nitrogen specific [Desulfitobacterium dichloroeliminans LMG P-21439]